MLREWKDLPEWMQTEEVKKYYDSLYKKKNSLAIKRVFDIVVSAVLLAVFAIPMLVIAILIVKDSKGGVFYRQERVTAYGKKFRIHKFRTMVSDADKKGTHVTVGNDPRITKIGAKLRGYRLDELPQLIDVFLGDMTFVGTRPEAVKYVEKYSKKMVATLLLPAGITSEASIKYKDEAELLEGASDPDKVYVEKVLPEKMKYNLKELKEFSIFNEIKILFKTVVAVIF